MQNHFIILVILIIMTLTMTSMVNCQKNKTLICNKKTESRMDEKFARIFVYGQNRTRFPESGQLLRPYCNQVITLLDEVDGYTKQCLNKFGKDSSAVVMHTINNEIRGLCKTGRLNKRAKALIDAAPCANAGVNRGFDDCYFAWIDKYMGLLNADIKLRIPMACCNFHEYQRCYRREGEDLKQCSPKQLDYLIKWFFRMMEGILRVLCLQYDESNSQCDSIAEKTPVRKANQRRFKSILLPTFKIAMSLGDGLE